jgi:hypothetical protein
MDIKKFQNGALLLAVFFLVSNTVYDKITTSKPSFFHVQHDTDMYDVSVPEKFEFCGEPVPLTETDVKEKFDRELLVNANIHASTLLILKRANRWFPQIEPILKEEGIPDDFKYLLVIESSIANAVSPSGATGYWQIMKPTAKELGLEVSEEVDERYHVLKSTRAACKYLKNAYNQFGNWTNVAASYNMGVTGLMRSLMRQKTKSYYDLLLNQETARYVYRILALKEIMQNPRKYRFGIDKRNLYYKEEVDFVTVDTSITNLIDFAHQLNVSYKTLKNYNNWLLSDKLTIDKNNPKSYTFEIPKNARFQKDETYANLKKMNQLLQDSIKEAQKELQDSLNQSQKNTKPKKKK